MSLKQEHHNRIREAFTRQATAYAATASVMDPQRIARLIQAVQPTPLSRVLEVATGPGYVAIAFAEYCYQVVGIDLTEVLVKLAQQHYKEKDLTNVHFQVGDAGTLPFADAAFDVVVCRFALHHFHMPKQILGEMARVCVPDGRITLEDLVVSEHPERANYHNHFERLRDPSHRAAVPLSLLLKLYAAVGLEVMHVATDYLTPEVDRWLANAQTPEDRSKTVRQLIEQDSKEDLSGTQPFCDEDGKWYFTQRTATVVGRKLIASSITRV